jgi:hypothetical protein
VQHDTAERNGPRRLHEQDEREKNDAVQPLPGNLCGQPQCHALVLSATGEPYLRRGSTLALILGGEADPALAERLDPATRERQRKLQPAADQ